MEDEQWEGEEDEDIHKLEPGSCQYTLAAEEAAEADEHKADTGVLGPDTMLKDDGGGGVRVVAA
jgi:hypothetical protein